MKYFPIVTHLAAATIISGIMLSIYVSVQQVHRSMADDPQLQLAGDIDAGIRAGKPVDRLVPGDTIDISTSLGTFVTFFNERGTPVRSTGLLDGSEPRLPAGVFDVARKNSKDVFTWQPRPGVRVATVLVSTPSGFVAAGRSLREVEAREGNLTDMVVIAWIACLAVIALHGLLMSWSKNR